MRLNVPRSSLLRKEGDSYKFIQARMKMRAFLLYLMSMKKLLII